MVDSPNLKIPHVEVGQLSKETTVNTGTDRHDVSNNDNVDIDCSAGGTIIVTEAQYLDNQQLRLTGTPAGAFNLQVPDGNRKFVVNNTTAQTASVDTTTGSTPIPVLTNAKTTFMVRSTVIEEFQSSTPGSSIFGKKTEYLPAAAWRPAVTNGCGSVVDRELATNKTNVAVRGFDTGIIEEAWFTFPFPDRYDNGTITFRVRYTHLGTQTAGLDGVTFGLAAVAVADDGTLDVALGTEILVNLDRVNGNDVHITAESAVLTIAGTPASGKHVLFRLRRKRDEVLDDLDIDADLIGVEIFWTEATAVDNP